jgi:hypothetical protein
MFATTPWLPSWTIPVCYNPRWHRQQQIHLLRPSQQKPISLNPNENDNV